MAKVCKKPKSADFLQGSLKDTTDIVSVNLKKNEFLNFLKNFFNFSQANLMRGFF